MKAIALSLLVLTAAGCGAPNSSPLKLTAARPYLGSTAAGVCTRSELFQGAGTLDIGASQSYLMTFDVIFDVLPNSVTVGGEDLNSTSQNIFISDSFRYTFTSTPALAFETETVPVRVVYAPNSGDGSYIATNLLTRKAAEVLVNGVPVNGDPVDLLAEFSITGQTASGTQITSNTVKFPITVYNRGAPAACAGAVARTGPCGTAGGQDSFYACCSDPTYAGSSACN